MSIPGKLVRLRAIEEPDLPALLAWANDEELWSNLGGWRLPSNSESIKRWFATLGADPLNNRFAIETLDGGRLIGTTNLVDIDWKNGHATNGITLGPPDERRRGYGLDTVMAVMRYAFDELRLERLETDIIEYNEASLRLYIGKCGWTEEGRARRWHFRKGRYWDKVLLGVTRAEYAKLVETSGYWTT